PGPLQHAALPEPGIHPGRDVDDDDHPGPDLPGLPAVLHPGDRDQRGREIGAARTRAGAGPGRADGALRVALTFDAEHPDRRHRPGVTEGILDVLASRGIRSTWFLQGRWVEANPDADRRGDGRGRAAARPGGGRSHRRPVPCLAARDARRAADADRRAPGKRRALRPDRRARPVRRMTTRRPAVLAIDGGNSKADVALLAADGTVLGAVRGPTISHQAVPLPEATSRLRMLIDQVRIAAGAEASP